MTVALCIHCGGVKGPVLVPCQTCQRTPEGDDEIVLAMALSDHYLDIRVAAPPIQEVVRRARTEGADATEVMRRLAGVEPKFAELFGSLRAHLPELRGLLAGSVGARRGCARAVALSLVAGATALAFAAL